MGGCPGLAGGKLGRKQSAALVIRPGTAFPVLLYARVPMSFWGRSLGGNRVQPLFWESLGLHPQHLSWPSGTPE